MRQDFFPQIPLEALLAALQSTTDDETRFTILLQLGVVADPRAVEPLTGVLEDENSLIRAGAAWALGQIGHPNAISALIKALEDEDEDVQDAVTAALAKIGEPAIGALISGLSTSNWYIRANIAAVLGEIATVNCVDALLLALKDSNPYTRAGAADALGVIGDARTVPAMLRALEDDNPDVRGRTAQALGFAAQQPDVIDALLVTAQDELPVVKIGAILSLAIAHDKQAEPVIIDALTHEDATVVATACLALQWMDPIPDAIPILLMLLNHADEWVRHNAIQTLGTYEDKQVVPALLERLKAEDVPELLEAIVIALGAIGGADAKQPLKRYLKKADPELAVLIQGTLLQLGDDKAIVALTDAIRSTEPSIRSQAVWALEQTKDPRAVKPLIGALLDSEPDIRADAAGALGVLKDESAVLALVNLVKNDEVSDVRQEATIALSQIGDRRCIPTLVHALQHDDNATVRAEIAYALEVFAEERAYKPLMMALLDVDPLVREAAATTLGVLHYVEAQQSLKTLLNDPFVRVREAATKALEQLET